MQSFPQQGIDSRLEALLDEFEREVEPYDKWSAFSILATPIGIIVCTLFPLLLYQPALETNPFSATTSSHIIYYIVGGIISTMFLAKIPILYADYKKHQISRVKYRPLSGVCMCDLSQLRLHYRKLEKATTLAQRIKYANLVEYYKKQIGWQN